MAPTDRRPWGPRAPHLLNEVHERLPAAGHRGVPAEHDVRPGDFRGVYVGGRPRDLHVTWRRYKRIEDGDRRPARPQGPAHWGPGRHGRSPSQRRPSCRPCWARGDLPGPLPQHGDGAEGLSSPTRARSQRSTCGRLQLRQDVGDRVTWEKGHRPRTQPWGLGGLVSPGD